MAQPGYNALRKILAAQRAQRGVIAVPGIPTHLYAIHLLLMLSPALFALTIFFAVLPGEQGESMSKEQISVFQTVAATLAIITVGLSQLVPRFVFRPGSRAGIRGSVKATMRQYVTVKIVQWALLEGSALFIATVFYLTRQKNMLIPLGVLIALLAMARPTIDEIARYNIKE